MAGRAVGFQRSQGIGREVGYELTVDKILHDGVPLADAATSEHTDVEIQVLGTTGSIGVQSQLGEGTCFHLFLPVTNSAAPSTLHGHR